MLVRRKYLRTYMDCLICRSKMENFSQRLKVIKIANMEKIILIRKIDRL